MAIRFLTFELDPDRRELSDRGTLVSLSPKSFDVLCYLIAHRDRMVTKSELLDAFWSTQVSEAAMQKAISLLRKATHCDGQSIIRTYHGLGFRFVPDVLIQLQDPHPPAGSPVASLQERRLIAVLCLRLCTQTAPQDFVVESFLESAGSIVEAHQGEALRMTLDGFTASFGLTSHYEDAARRAVHCARALINLAKEFDEISPIIAIDYGPVNLTGDTEDINWSRPSDIERAAVTLANIGQPNDILLSPSTQHQLRDEVVCTAQQQGFKLVSVNDMPTGVPARPRKNPANFVGRGAEMAFLGKSLEALDDGNGQGVVLSGPAGIGKTRLLGEFLKALDTQFYHTLKLQCSPGLSNSPLAPVRELCLTLFAQAPSGTLQSDVDVALHAELIGETTSHVSVLDALSEHQRKQQSYALISRMLAAFCADKPLVLAFEDVHWLDLTSRDCIESLISQADDMRLLIVMTTRPTGDPPLSEMVVQLPPLGHRDGLKLLHDNTNDTMIDDLVAGDLVRRAAGNPFFIEELALAAQSGGDPSRELPDTVQAVISVRIGALDPAARTFLYVIAAIGPQARAELVRHILGQNSQSVDATAERLRSMGFVQIEPDSYSFRHMLIHDTAYAMLASNERQRLHANIAAFLDSDAPHWTPRPETLAWHYQEAGQNDQATSYWLKAGRAAVRRFAHREGIVFAQNGLALMSEGNANDTKRELDLQLCLASALAAIKGYAADDTGAAYYQALELNKEVDNSKAKIRGLVGLWIHTWVRGQLSKSLGYAQDLLDVAQIIQDPALTLQAHASVGQVLFHKGDMQGALPHLTAGLEAIAGTPPSTLPSQSASVACSAFACWTNSYIGDEAEAKRILNLSYKLAHIHKNPLAEAIHFGLGTAPLMVMQEVEHCLDYANRGISVCRAHDFAFWLGNGLIIRGWALGQLGKMQSAFDALDEGFAVIETTGAGVQLANWYGLKAETLLSAGRFKEGLAVAERALDCAVKTEDLYFVPRIHAIAARLCSELNLAEKSTIHARLSEQTAAEFGMVKKVITLLI